MHTMKCEDRYKMINSGASYVLGSIYVISLLSKTRANVLESYVAVKEGHEETPRALQRNFKSG